MDSIYDPRVEEQYVYEGTLRSLEQMVKEADSIAQLGKNAIKRLQDEEASGSKHLVPAELFMRTIRGLRNLYLAVDEAANFNRYHRTRKGLPPIKDITADIVLVHETEDVVIVASPHFPRRRYNKTDIANFEDSAMRSLRNSERKFIHHGKVDLYIIPAYPSEASPYETIDCDNLNTKSIGDPLCDHIRIDDNCLCVHWHMFGLRSDEIEPFVYTVAMRKGEKTLSESEAISLIKEADFASNIPKNPNLENLI